VQSFVTCLFGGVRTKLFPTATPRYRAMLSACLSLPRAYHSFFLCFDLECLAVARPMIRCLLTLPGHPLALNMHAYRRLITPEHKSPIPTPCPHPLSHPPQPTKHQANSLPASHIIAHCTFDSPQGCHPAFLPAPNDTSPGKVASAPDDYE